METKNGEQIRMEEIQTLAKGYQDLQIDGKIKLLQLVQADVKDERRKLEDNLGKIDALLGVSSPRPKTVMQGTGPAKVKRGRVTGGMTTSDAIITALQAGEEMDIATITGKVEGQSKYGQHQWNTHEAGEAKGH